MTKSKDELLIELKNMVIEMEDEEIAEVAQEYIDAGYDAYEGIMEGLVAGMNVVSEYYDEGEYFITDVLIASDAMYNGLDVIQPHLEKNDDEKKVTGVIGVVEGDTHDIGKNLVKIMMETAGFNMIDLGRDVPLSQFVDAAIESDAQLVCMSTLMTTTMGGMETVIQHLEEAGIRDKVKVMIGGGPISNKFAEKIGADAYTENAVEAAKRAKELLNIGA